MAFDQPQVAALLPDGKACPEHGTRVRIRFRKGGDVRFVSHHDLMHCFERMFRRAALPVQATRGFNPKPRMVFALSLALGLVGAAEVLELDLDEALSAEEIRQRLTAQAPAGLEILEVRAIGSRMRAQVRRAFYSVPLPAALDTQDLCGRVAGVLAAPECWIQRTRPQPRRIDLRPYISELRVHENHLEMALWVTPTGAARPEEILHLMGLGEVVEAGVSVIRTHLELHDEVFSPAESVPAGAGQQGLNVNHDLETMPSVPSGQQPAPRPEVEPRARPTSLIAGPLSFDS
jgi:radical SAM-linked protein